MTTAQPLRHAVPDEIADKLWAERTDTDNFLRELRRRGAFKVESIGTLRRVGNFTLGTAKDIVHFSPVWADTREADEQLQEAVIEGLRNSGWDRIDKSHTVKLAS